MPAGIIKDRYGVSFANAGEPAWHGLGNPIPVGASTQEILQAARLSNWNVRTVKYDALAYEDDDELRQNPIEIPLADSYQRLVVRTNPDNGQVEFLGRVTGRYQAFSNEELAALADSVMEFDSGTYWDTAGAIENNQKVFMSLKLGDEIIIDPNGANDRILQHILLTTGHTGNMSVWTKNVGTRVVCANTYAMAMGENTPTYTFRHLKGQVDKDHDIASALGITRNYFKTLEEVANTLYETPMETKEFVKYVDTLYPKPEERDLGLTQSGEIRKDKTHSIWEMRRDDLVDIWNGTGKREVNTIDNIRGTAWAGFNAFSEYIDWYGAKSKGKNQLIQASSMANAKILTSDGKSVDAKPYGLEVLKELVSS
jgi:phage/plasmid-like protein (TIGR03299 family)